MAHLYALPESHDAPRPLRAIAHDLNNLLTAISGYGSLIATSDDVPAEAQRDAGEIVEAAASAVVVVRQLRLHS